MKAEQYQERQEQLSGWPVKIVSYKLGGRYYVTVHNVQPGAWIAKAEGAILQEAEQKACAEAASRLSKTRRVS